ncbi:hypothetical protein GUITHDRAFT_154764 [Guillardia theta CCMP2712]|uniref:Uncharacterized protein n=2 Tax=Guillardia theta TaxID=55529 RepID=L1IQF3_GUITC|nr:hypothetical protein GUITHDRAFT_154764 [Guillardia theta CCMP2712]EKX38282.1 hypothetical protein GUITHDRAFT_154764 [Guillardia theta CCMP2712]|eukprot:XP_005825262.1 hypothetical protein GUITHDRAFT_154764 [Guillardia theta CCMP2712]
MARSYSPILSACLLLLLPASSFSFLSLQSPSCLRALPHRQTPAYSAIPSAPSGTLHGSLRVMRTARGGCSSMKMEDKNSGYRQDEIPRFQSPPPMSKAQEAMLKSVLEKAKTSKKIKRVEFKTQVKSMCKVEDNDVAENVTLGTYMTLPAEQWITLDDNYIQRLDDGSNPDDVKYRFTLPLKPMMQLPLTATCDVSVHVDKKKQQLRLEACGARLRASTAEEDASPAPANAANMSMAPPNIPPNFTESIEKADLQMGFKTLIKWKEGKDASSQGQLDLSAEVDVAITFPPPLSLLPGFLLRQACGLVLKAASSTILPRFGQLVAEDYRRWSRNEPRVGGSLAAPSFAQQLEEDPYYASSLTIKPTPTKD